MEGEYDEEKIEKYDCSDPGKNEPPRGRDRAVSEVEIEELKLLVIRILSLLADILPDHVPVPTLSYGGHEKSICPQLSTPKFSSQIRVPAEHFFCRDALDHSDHL